jgi:hypothetical protein
MIEIIWKFHLCDIRDSNLSITIINFVLKSEFTNQKSQISRILRVFNVSVVYY